MAEPVCPVCGFDGSRLAPRDGAAALRSFPRRYRGVLARPEEEERPDDVLHRRPRGGGLSAIEHVAWATHGITGASEAMRLVLIQDRPVVTVPEIDPSPDAVPDGSEPGEVALARLEAAVAPPAKLVDNTYGEDWKRTGVTTDGSPVSALALLAAAVHFGSHHLRATDRTINQVARELP
jgi:hypothetical protein